MIHDMTYKRAVSQAAALKTLGETEIHLYRDPDLPWHIADSCEPGGMTRLSMPTSAKFSGRDPATGLRFYWYFDIELREANGSGHYQIDVDACKQVLRNIKGDALIQFREYLSSCVAHVSECAKEYQDVADKQNRIAAVLRDLVAA